MDEYQGYELDCYSLELTKQETELIDSVIWLIDNKASLRVTSKNCLVSKSTLHRFIHEKLSSISYEIYKCALRVLNNHKK